ncbi:predicted protein [Sclerotinia sclerotiorum 1980 UF-70]|uniref:Uncharacterized protein n=2 Tax=Sclerotinia sclerotiorum (strain ATCC 18683 / 1980 / Ss-1) TaxID=665079 RepID=A7EHZ1_SCLS1|nr:predicted protein [Sclerotinia sclerotiorum 1980 UF-70]APA11521.1 hypothetical protein sscle_08g062910 [Sclerotinia sclerotiorum 1980 UF-70]EDO02457.1 predicted protein [Sclerotinia sclerotiorum 1980 UF-70]
MVVFGSMIVASQTLLVNRRLISLLDYYGLAFVPGFAEMNTNDQRALAESVRARYLDLDCSLDTCDKSHVLWVCLCKRTNRPVHDALTIYVISLEEISRIYQLANYIYHLSTEVPLFRNDPKQRLTDLV